jgi:hypothetical protein
MRLSGRTLLWRVWHGSSAHVRDATVTERLEELEGIRSLKERDSIGHECVDWTNGGAEDRRLKYRREERENQ